MRARQKINPCVTFIIALLIGGVTTSSSTTPSFSIPNDASGTQGSYVSIPIEVSGASNVGSLYINLTYDPNVLSVQNVTTTELTNTSLLQWNTIPLRTLLIAMIDSSGITGSGSVATITFFVVGYQGATSPLTFEKVEANDVYTLAPISVTTENGQFLVEKTQKRSRADELLVLLLFLVVSILISNSVFFWWLKHETRESEEYKRRAKKILAVGSILATAVIVLAIYIYFLA
jgi:Rieske Fe-S protein